MWKGPQIPAIECDGFTGMLQMNPPFMSKTSALHEHHACLYFASSFTARLRRKTSVCDVLCRAPNPPQLFSGWDTVIKNSNLRKFVDLC